MPSLGQIDFACSSLSCLVHFTCTLAHASSKLLFSAQPLHMILMQYILHMVEPSGTECLAWWVCFDIYQCICRTKTKSSHPPAWHPQLQCTIEQGQQAAATAACVSRSSIVVAAVPAVLLTSLLLSRLLPGMRTLNEGSPVVAEACTGHATPSDI